MLLELLRIQLAVHIDNNYHSSDTLGTLWVNGYLGLEAFSNYYYINLNVPKTSQKIVDILYPVIPNTDGIPDTSGIQFQMMELFNSIRFSMSMIIPAKKVSYVFLFQSG